MSEQDRLNSLDRFRKRSQRLVLEAHGNCEVPAGCGGAVLRWRNPLNAVPVTIFLYAPVEAACFLDGAPVRTGRIDLAPGRHAVALVLESVDLSAGLFMFAAIYEPKEDPADGPTELVERPLKVVTQGDGTWKFSLDKPATEEWMSPAFDDHDWPALTKVAMPELAKDDPGRWQCGRCREQGAACLGLPQSPADAEEEVALSWWQKVLGRRVALAGPSTTGAIWVRKTFTVSPPERRP